MAKLNLAGVTISTLTVAWVVALVGYESTTPRPTVMPPREAAAARSSTGGFPMVDDAFARGGPPRDTFTGDDGFDLGSPPGPRTGGGSRNRVSTGGPSAMLAAQFIRFGDTDHDGKLTPAELTALADAWFDKLDFARGGKLAQQEFADRLNDLLSAPQGPGVGSAPAAPAWGGGGFGRGIAKGLFAAADDDRDSLLTRDELRTTFTKWSAEWDKDNNGRLDVDELRTGLKADATFAAK